MPDVRTSLLRGLLVGAAGVALWSASRRLGGARPSLLDWSWAGSVAERVSGRDGRLDADEKHRLQSEYRALVQSVEQPLQEYTGTVLPLSDTSVEVMDRPGWIKANLANFQVLFEPVEDA